jgi:predicted metal-dependent hydrolase
MKICSAKTVEQLELPFRHDEYTLKLCFEKLIGRPVSLTITDNTSNMLSVKTDGRIISMRLQRIFLEAGRDILHEIVEFTKKRNAETPKLNNFIHMNTHKITRKNSARTVLKTRGKYFNLKQIYDSLNEEYFDSRVSSLITWGSRHARRNVKQRTLGSYDIQVNLIRINSLLDRSRVPNYFITYIVYHEMLHADMEQTEQNGRARFHSREFKRRERLFKDYEKAVAWGIQ